MSETASEPVLQVRDLRKAYTTGSGELLQVVDGVSFTVHAGELVAVYGPSGSGKTTLLKLLARVLEADEGSVVVRGRDVASLTGPALDGYWLNDLGLMLQASELLPGLTVQELAAVRLIEKRVRRREAIARVTPLLERLDLGEKLGELARNLSPGERQRVALAKALSTEPAVVLADEPTGSLDRERATVVLELLAEVCRERGAATLITTHDPQATTVADQAWTLRDGRLVDRAPTPSALQPAAPEER